MKRILFLSIFALSTPLAAQSSAAATAGTLWSQTSDYIIKSAEQMPEANFSFRPTPEVRTFGQIIGHVAGSQYMYCALVLGDKAGGEGDIEKTKTTKADLVAAMKASTEYCRRAYALSDADAQGMIKLFGSDRSKLYALMGNATHDSEHYGNLVTYLRIKGMVPPSSQPAPGQ
ncbi:MAG TPA: DinB family protein [Gemmatimonadaceae bacterium]|nr:DinB family protein [Gemmatimonadaceae bacterium]